ncbi:dTDP-4-dehydrorhamnose 3,5-epimerase [Pantoea allii]|uniref:dTDP-4-dehydrorhamnose 3,5-epimerase n=1 Tax=Pantoea allii TaxID=574096 RepID=UPI0024B79258|nr:dTDP-4-dehydrorhamnose 3,5-epimerase [Pantoea allii]MDJ0036569.1 dTDP-4-dehydrorhamnose 3,5-epimerase [Pantoea allii]
MIVTSTSIPDVLIFEPKKYDDDRGYFYESFNHRLFEEAVGRPVTFVQDNQSQSRQRVIRGLHFQTAPSAQGKLVRCVSGEVYDVAVDIRPDSPTFGQHVGVHLSDENRKQLWIPEGFAHGFATLSETAIFLYKTTNYYDPASERSVLWSDEDLNIDWKIANPVLSDKDMAAPLFKNILEAKRGH